MKDIRDNELLSAYLDGELNDQQRTEVEQLLTTSAEARRLLDELRAVSTTLKSLPRHTLDEDLSGRVLQSAERRILTEPREPATPRPKPPQSGPRRFLTPRSLIFSGLAVAAAVAVMFLGTNQLDGPARDHVAMAPVPTAEEEPIGPIPEAEMRAVGETRLEAAKGSSEARSSMKHSGKSAAPAAGKSPAPAAALENWAASSPRTRPAAPEPPQPASPVDAKLGTHPEFADKLSTLDMQAKAPGPTRAKKADSYFSATDRQQVAEEVLVVECDITPETAQQRTFDQLLTQNFITLVDTAPMKTGRLDQVTKYKKNQTDAFAIQQAVPAEPVDLVYVEATPAQIESTLAQLVSLPKQFLNVNVEPAAQVTTQQNLVQYNRGNIAGRKSSTNQEKFRFGVDRPRSQEAAEEPTLGDNSSRRLQRKETSARLGQAQRVQLPATASVEELKSNLAIAQQRPTAIDQAPPTLDQPEEEAEGNVTRQLREPQPEPTYRALFVLRVVGGSIPEASFSMPSVPGAVPNRTTPAKSAPAGVER